MLLWINAKWNCFSIYNSDKRTLKSAQVQKVSQYKESLLNNSMVACGYSHIMKAGPPSHIRAAQATPIRGETKWIEYLLLSFHFTFWFARVAVFSTGLWFQFNAQTKSISKQENDQSFQLLERSWYSDWSQPHPWYELACWAAVTVQESQCTLGFFVFLLVIFALKITATTWGYSHKYEVIKELQEFYTNTYFKLKSKNEP